MLFVAWFLIVIGAAQIVLGVPFIIFGGFFSLGIFTKVLSGALMFAAGSGLRNMRKWGLYIFTATTVVMILLYLYDSLTKGFSIGWVEIATLSLEILLTVYLWMVYKKYQSVVTV